MPQTEPPKIERKNLKASARQRASKPSSKKYAFSIDPFDLSSIRRVEVLGRAIEGSFFLFLTNYVSPFVFKKLRRGGRIAARRSTSFPI